MTREEFEAAAERHEGGLLARCVLPVRDAMALAALTTRDVDEVLVVGAATRMPCVARMLAKGCGFKKSILRKHFATCTPETAVAIGAAAAGGRRVGEWR